MRRLRIARPGVRVKMTLGFAAAMAVLLAALGAFIYVRSERSLDRSLDEGLRSRAEDVRALVMQADTGLSQAGRSSLATPGERFAQIIGADGRVLDRTPSLPPGAILSPGEQRRSSAGPTLIARKQLPAPAGSSRLLAVPVTAQDQRMTVVVGASLRQRDLALADVRNVLLIGGPAALALASLLGYALAALSLRSVELMRRRAAGVSVLEPGQRLPVPPGNDELARLARTLNEMLARNEVAVQRERTFVADASHELRSPLAILRAELDVALLGESPPEELRRAVASAAEEADRLSVLAEDLLVLAQADRDRLSIKREAIDVRDSLERLADRFAPVAREAGATIDARAPSGLVVHADRRRLEQALGNLLDNALRHGAGRVLVRGEVNGGQLQLHVSDDGPGFPTDFLAHAFERFARPDRSRTASGAGLGLSIVQAIARAHGGAAYVSNGAGGGAHVCLELPLGTRHPLATIPASAPIGAAA